MSALAQLVLAAACQFGQLRHVCTCAVGFGGSFDLEMAEKLSYSIKALVLEALQGKLRALSFWLQEAAQSEKKGKDPKPSCERFALVSQQNVDAAQKPIIPQNTQKSTDWSVHLFTSWLSQRNQRCPNDKCP